MTTQTNKLDWYWKRLRTMNLAELNYRLAGAARNLYERQFKVNYSPSIKLEHYPKPILHLPEGNHTFNTQTFSIFGQQLDLTQSIDWHKDIISNTVFPLQFSRSINTRTEEHGIVKVVWEVNRLQFLTNICLQYHITKKEKYLNQFITIVQSWKAANPYLMGVNWYSNIEISLRIITWFLCWEMLEASNLIKQNSTFKKFVEKDWIPLIYLHSIYAHTHPSKFSSSNNHLIAEATGLFVASTYWDLPGTEHWRKEAQAILEREMIRQHSENGINKEEASEYIQFITDFFLIALIVGERKGFGFSEKYKNRLHNILHYIYSVMDAAGNVPYYGDDDDGHTFILKTKKSCNNFQSLLASGAILFNDAQLKTKAGGFDLKNEILFGSKGKATFEALPSKKHENSSKIYADEGHLIFKSDKEENEIFLHIDAAPLGFLSIAAHGHADALSFFLHLGGIPFFIDTGTYTYHSEPAWRAYFKGTLAHNTIRVDEQDQANNGGPCLWNNHYQCQLLEYSDSNETSFAKATHNGYQKLGISHTRMFTFDKITKKIRILDTLISKGSNLHTYEFPFHLNPDVLVKKTQTNQFLLSYPDTDLKAQLTIDSKCNPQIIKGSTKPILGWTSPSFLIKKPTNTIYSKLEHSGNLDFETLIEIL